MAKSNSVHPIEKSCPITKDCFPGTSMSLAQAICLKFI